MNLQSIQELLKKIVFLY